MQLRCVSKSRRDQHFALRWIPIRQVRTAVRTIESRRFSQRSRNLRDIFRHNTFRRRDSRLLRKQRWNRATYKQKQDAQPLIHSFLARQFARALTNCAAQRANHRTDPHAPARLNSAHPNLCVRSEEHTSELQSHSFISYAVFCLKKKKTTTTLTVTTHTHQSNRSSV